MTRCHLNASLPFIHHRLDSIALAISLVITIKLTKWADRWKAAT